MTTRIYTATFSVTDEDFSTYQLLERKPPEGAWQAVTAAGKTDPLTEYARSYNDTIGFQREFKAVGDDGDESGIISIDIPAGQFPTITQPQENDTISTNTFNIELDSGGIPLDDYDLLEVFNGQDWIAATDISTTSVTVPNPMTGSSVNIRARYRLKRINPEDKPHYMNSPVVPVVTEENGPVTVTPQLTRVTTPMVIDAPGSIVENLSFDGFNGDEVALEITAPNVEVRNCRFTDCMIGIKAESSADGIHIHSNYFRDNGTHIQVRACTNPQVHHNLMGRFGVYDIATAVNASLGWACNAISFNGASATETGQHCRMNIIDCTDTRSIDVWNDGNGGQEDAISIFETTGTSADIRFLISENQIRGIENKGSPTGGGITTGDSSGGYCYVYKNTIVNYGGFGIGVAGGNHQQIEQNRAYGSETHCGGEALLPWHPHNNNNSSNYYSNKDPGWGTSYTDYNQAQDSCHDNVFAENDTTYYNRAWGWKGAGSDLVNNSAAGDGTYDFPGTCSKTTLSQNNYTNTDHADSLSEAILPVDMYGAAAASGGFFNLEQAVS